MALSPTQRSLCNKVASDYYTLVAPVKSAKRTIQSKTSDLDTYLRGLSYSPAEDVSNAVTSFENSVQNSIPGDADESIDELKGFLSQCDYLSDFAPTSTVKGTSAGIFDNINSLIDDLLSSIPEFGAAKIADAINSLLDGVGLPGGDLLSELLKKADKLLNCLSALCAAEDSSYTGNLSDISTDLQGLYDDLNIVDNPLSSNYGKFDYTSFYNNIGLTSTQQNTINNVTSVISTQKLGAQTAINNSIDAVKGFIKGGLF